MCWPELLISSGICCKRLGGWRNEKILEIIKISTSNDFKCSYQWDLPLSFSVIKGSFSHKFENDAFNIEFPALLWLQYLVLMTKYSMRSSQIVVQNGIG